MSSAAFLEEALRRLELLATPAALAGLRRFREYVLAARGNVTGFRTEMDVDLKGIADSLTCLQAIRPAPGQRLVDVGSGAGFPGVPLALVIPGLQVTLLEASERKGLFLRQMVADLSLEDVKVATARAEDFGRTAARETFDIAVARAVGSLAVLAEYGLPLVKIGGVLVAMKGPAVGEELAAGTAAAHRLGGGSPAVVEMDLPVLGHRRTLVLFRKIRSTPAGYPRRTGVPARRPL